MSQASKLTIPEAAEILGITQSAVWQRVKRDTIEHQKDESSGKTYVYLEPSTVTNNESPNEGVNDTFHDTLHNALIDELRDRIGFLERQLEKEQRAHGEVRRLLAGALERIPELEPAGSPETRESPENASAGAEGVEVPLQAERPPWWRRMFG